MKKYSCCFTGHRQIAPAQKKYIAKRLEEVVINLISKGYRYFATGGAVGFDTLASECILSLKKQYPHIKLILVLPCPSQSNFWNFSDISTYEKIKIQADKVVYIAQQYSRTCIFQRNRHLVDHSSVCIAYQLKPNGGTAYTVDYAHKQNLQVINIAYVASH